MRDQEFIDLENAYAKIYEQVQNEPVEEVDNYDEILEYLLSEGYSKEESDQIMVELVNEAGLGSLLKGAKAVAGFIAKRAKTPLRTAATDSLITSTALNPVSTAKVAKTIAKSAPSPAPIVRTVKAPPVRTAPKGANKITTNVWNEPTAPSSRINPSKPSGTKVTSTKALSGTPSRPALPSVGKTSATVKAPKPTFKPEALPKATKFAEPAGALVRTKAPKPTSKTTTSGGGKPSKGGGLTQTIRATLSPAEKTGNMKYPGLEKYATGSSSSGGPSRAPISALSRNLKTAGIVGTALAGTAALDQGLKSEKRRRDTEMRKNIKTDVYNTMDAPSIDKPTGQIRSRLKVGSRKIGSTFDDAFREAKRKEKEAKRIGDPVPTTFTYAGKEYSTKMKENYVNEEYLIDYLLGEGFASDEKSAEAIMGAMSEEWKHSIIEMDEFAAGGGNAKMKQTGMSRDQVISLGKKNLAAKPSTSSSGSSSSSGRADSSTPSDVVRDRLSSREKYRDSVNKSIAAGVRGPAELLKKQAAQDQESKFNKWYEKNQKPGPNSYYKPGYKNLAGTFEKG